MPTTRTIRKMTSKGQITLPASWRARAGTDLVELVDKGDRLEINPAEIISGEEVLFDAVRDNGGKGIPVADLIHALKKDLAV